MKKNRSVKLLVAAIVCWVISLALIVVGILCFTSVLGQNIKETPVKYFAFGYGGLLLLIGLLCFYVSRKAKREQNKESASEQSTNTPDINAEQIIEDGSVTERDGNSFKAYFAAPSEIEYAPVVENGVETVYDFLWCNKYESEYFMVVGLKATDGYNTYLLHIDNDHPETAHFVTGGAVQKKALDDFESTVNSLTEEDEQQTHNIKALALLDKIKSRIKRKEPAPKKTRIELFCSVAALYLILLGYGLYLYFWFSSRGDSGVLISAIGIAYALITPSFLLFWATFKPFKTSRAGNIALIVVGVVLLVAADVVGWVLISNLPEVTSGVIAFFKNIFLPVTLIVATLTYIVAYLYWNINLPEKWQTGTAFVVTVLFPVATAIIFVLLAVALIVAFVRWILSSFGVMLGGSRLEKGFRQGYYGEHVADDEFKITDEYGNTITVKHYDGDSYTDGYGNTYTTDDGGNTFHKK